MASYEQIKMTEVETISQLLNSSLNNDPDKPAIIFNDRPYSYKEIDRASDTLAARLHDSGLSGERVAFMLPNGFEILITYLACFKSGAVATPLNRRYAPPEFHRVLLNAQPKWLIMETDKLNLLDDLELDTTHIEKIFVVGKSDSEGYKDFSTLLGGSDSFSIPEQDSTQPAVIFHTSGSTGEPKGVVHTRSSVRGVLKSTSEALQGVTHRDIILVSEPQVHISGFIETFAVLAHGGTVVLHDGFEIDRYLASLEGAIPTLIATHIDILMKLLDSGRCTRDTFSSLRGVYTGGDELPSIVQKRFLELAGKPIQLGYGMTEAIWLTVCREAVLKRRGCIGKPVADVELRVVDQGGSDVPSGVIGVILVRGPMVFSHYWNYEKATLESFIDGWFRTGDCGMVDESGYYWYAGRIKNIIIRNTSNITPGEVEEALYKHPDVEEAGVIGLPDPHEGQVPIAFVVAKKGAKMTEQELKDFASRQIAPYKIPTRIFFIEGLPEITSGKIDHKKLYDFLPTDMKRQYD
jgi:long-chain acyl-CoA synthetase